MAWTGWRVGFGALVAATAALSACSGGGDQTTRGTGGHAAGSSSSAGSSTGGGGAAPSMLTCKVMAATPETLFVKDQIGEFVGTSDGTLYYADLLAGISRLPQGSSTPEVVIGDKYAFEPMPVGSSFYYESQGSLWQASLATLPATGTKITDVANDTTGVFAYDDAAFYEIDSFTNSLVRYPFDGSASAVLATDVTTDPRQIAVAGGFVYYSDASGALKRVATTGGAPTVLDQNANPAGVATDGDVLVYTAGDPTLTTYDLVRIDLSNPSSRRAVPVVDTPGFIMSRVLFDAGHFYVAATNTILRVDPGLTICDIVGDTGTSDFAITDKYVYYSRSDHSLVRAPK